MPKSLRVAYTIEQSWHRVPGGTAVAALEVANEFAAGDQVDLVGVAAFHFRTPEPPWKPGFPVVKLGLPRQLMYPSWHRLRWPSVTRPIGEVSLIHATGMAVPPRDAPLVVTVHDLAWRLAPSHSTGRGRRFFESALEVALRDADLFLCSSHATAAALAAEGARPESIRVVPLGTRCAPIPEAEVEAAKSRRGLSRPYLIWVGTVEPRKNLPGLLRAVASMDRRDFDVVLVGPSGWMEDLDGLAAPLGNRVRAMGFLEARERDALVSGASVFCFPSFLEGFGLPVLEAMAQGTPVITSRATATEEVLGDTGHLVDPTDHRDIADAIETVLAEPEAAALQAERARERASTFTWARTAELTLNAYLEAVR